MAKNILLLAVLLVSMASCSWTDVGYEEERESLAAEYAVGSRVSNDTVALKRVVVSNGFRGYGIRNLRLDDVVVGDLSEDNSAIVMIADVDSVMVSCTLVSDCETLSVESKVALGSRVMLNDKSLGLVAISFAVVVEEENKEIYN